MKNENYITIRTICLQQTRNSFTRNLMVVIIFQMKLLMRLKKLLNLEQYFVDTWKF